MDELEKLLSGEVLEPTPPEGTEPKKVENTQEETQEEKDIKFKQEQLVKLNGAVAEAQGKLRELRKAKKQVLPEEDDIPKINMEDPSARAWDKHIKENVTPLQNDSDKERDEVRGIALKRFLSDKPALARNQEKLKELLENYHALSQGKITEKVSEVVEDYFNRAYAATFPNELLNAARSRRMDEVRNDSLFSEPAVSRGSTTYSSPKDSSRPIVLDEESRAYIKSMGYASVEEWQKDQKKYKNT